MLIEKRDVKTRELLDGAEFALYADEDCEEEKILDFTPRAGEKGVFDSGEFGITQADLLYQRDKQFRMVTRHQQLRQR